MAAGGQRSLEGAGATVGPFAGARARPRLSVPSSRGPVMVPLARAPPTSGCAICARARVARLLLPCGGGASTRMVAGSVPHVAVVTAAEDPGRCLPVRPFPLSLNRLGLGLRSNPVYLLDPI